MKIKFKATTLIELIIVIVLLGILLIPLAFMSLEFTREIVFSRNLGVVEGLAKTEMAKVNNISYASLASSNIFSYEGYPYDMQRTVTTVAGSSNNLKQVQVKLFSAGSVTGALANVITYVGNDALVPFGAGSAQAVGLANSLVASNGTVSGSNLNAVTVQNTGTSPVTITGLTVNFTLSGGGIGNRRITAVNFAGGASEWTGSLFSPASITLTTPFNIAAGGITTMVLNFNRTLVSVNDLIFLVNSDNSSSISYIWP